MTDVAETFALGAGSEQSSNILCYTKSSDCYEWSKRIFSSYVFATRALGLEYVFLLLSTCFQGADSSYED